jgi:hypothetical protein
MTLTGEVTEANVIVEGPDHAPVPTALNVVVGPQTVWSLPALLVQSMITGVPTHWQSLFQVSLMVLADPSSHSVPGTALPPQRPAQS